MVRRLLVVLVIAASALLGACASGPQLQPQQVADVIAPNFDGIYRLSYSANGSALYYRFYPDGIVVSARTEAPANQVLATLTLENANTSRGTWRVNDSELLVGVEEGTVWYDSRFDIRSNGRIALHGLPRNFEFLHTDDQGQVIAGR